jgi:putative ABC transport system permease protein
MLEGISGIAQRVEDVATDPKLMGLALAMGIATSMVAAFIPARNAARVDPVQALQKGKYQVLSAGENRIRRRTALAFATVAGVCLLVDGGPAVFYTGFFLAMLAALLLTPAMALWLTRAMRPLLGWLWPVEGALAADSLIQAPRRTSATVSALMLSLSMTIALGGVATASYESITGWIGTALNPDLFVTASPTLTSRSFRFPAEMGTELRQIDGVEEVQSVRTPRITFRGTPVMLITLEVGSWAARTKRPAVEGRADEMYRLTGEGKGAILSQTLSAMKGLHVGDTIEIPAPAGILKLPVVGVIDDWSDQQGSILLDRSVYRKWWNEDHVNTFRVYLRRGASLPAVRAEILAKLGANRRLFVLTNADVRTYITGLTDQWMAMSYSQIAVAVLVAVLGIMNTLTVSIMDRRRELGVLQAVGARRRQIRYTIWMEAFGVAFVGIVLGLGLGAIALHYVLDMTHRDISGMLLPYRFPVGIAGMLFPIILGAALVAALWPAESAVRGSLVQALEYE